MKILKTIYFTTLIFANILIANSASAQSMYRCGSTYQDRPCEGGKSSKLIGGTSSPSSSASSVSDAQCAKRGTDAQKIVWAREGGALQDQQLAKASSASEQKLINDVYAQRGTSSDIRAAIEADCIAAKEKAAQVAALLEAAKPQQSSTGTTAAQNKSGEASQNAAAEIKVKESTDRDAVNKKIRCNYIKTQLETISSKLHTGGNAATMDDLNQQKRDAERRLSMNEC